ncbi:MAG: Two-component sensor histidine kinase, partial [Candidatus Woesebacteria bacterium GW2011_GWA1_37_7]
ILVLVFNISTFVNLLPVYTLILTSFVSYAIIQHGLFDLRVLATQAFTVIIWIVLFSKIFVSQNLTESVMDSLIFISMVVFGTLLIRSVIREVQQREKLAELNDKLKALDAQKDEFISMAAHELRAPMTAIKGYISMVMEGDTGDIPEKARGFLADANSINERLIRLVNNMLNVSRIEEGRIVFQWEEEELSQVVRAVYNQFIPEAARKGLSYTLEIPKQVKDKVRVDPDRIHEVIANLISNAIKYTDRGSVKVMLSQSSKDKVKVEVIDTGSGISLVEQKKLFQKFYRVETNVGKTTGTGLGLYISRLLVEKFSGLIGIESQEGKGSNFWFELPILNPSN